jgi:hypothetical protein
LASRVAALSVMVVNQDHHINRILHRPGEHTLTVEEFETPWVAIVAQGARRFGRCR